MQRHCVFTYTELCRQGQRAIVSLRWYTDKGGVNAELDRLTIEVVPARREIVQIRGKLNARATEEQMKTVRHWAGDLGLVIAERWC
ncbi:hypothetical protein EON81_24330 [bacterium]|nr:MAG: hypothetical protein EON81_24330 [bacterium]